jgi:hypothetical protein
LWVLVAEAVVVVQRTSIKATAPSLAVVEVAAESSQRDVMRRLDSRTAVNPARLVMEAGLRRRATMAATPQLTLAALPQCQ